MRGQGGGGGMGLGLAITHQAAEAHGGHVELRNLPGKGRIFAIHLPDCVHPADADDERAPVH